MEDHKEKIRKKVEELDENYIKAANYICRYIDDPEEKENQLNDLRILTLEHAKIFKTCKSMDLVVQKLKEVVDLRIKEVHTL